MSKYTTGEVAKLCGVSVRTVQYYDTRKILEPTELSDGGRRLYSEEDLSKMKIICFLRDLGISLKAIDELICQENSNEVIMLILKEHEAMLKDELKEKERKLQLLKELQAMLKNDDMLSVKAIGDAAQIMERKKQTDKLHLTLILVGLPLEIITISTIILWATTGIYWPFLLYNLIEIPIGVWITFFYFKRVAYICPHCHQTFKPTFKNAFWANHTPNTRKLVCPHCSYKGFCVEIYKKENK